MTGYGLVNLKDMIQELGEGRTKEILSEFSCPLNKDVEFFLHCKAIEFARQGIAQTQLVVTSYKDKPVLVGYFTLSNKVLEIPRKNIIINAVDGEYNSNIRTPLPLIVLHTGVNTM